MLLKLKSRWTPSTASGASGLAGLVKIVSEQPTAETEGKVELSYADFNSSQIAAAYSCLSDNLNARIAVQQVKSDGFVENAFLNRSDNNGIDELTARISVDYFLGSDETSAKLRLYHFDIDNGYDAFSLDNDNVTQSDEPGAKTQPKLKLASIKIAHQLNNGD